MKSARLVKSRTQKPELSSLPSPVTDPRLVAFLLFIEGDQPCSDEDYASALADADALLTSYPLTEAFDKLLGRPELYEQASLAVHQRLTNAIDPESMLRLHAAVMPEVVGASQVGNERDPIEALPFDMRGLLWEYCSMGMLRGACLMYRLMTAGGAR